MKKMLKMFAVIGVAICIKLSLPLNAQPTACSEDSHCSSGFYCDEGAHFCRECIHCDELKRKSLTPRDTCVMSVVDCGPCLDGLIEDLRLDGGCVLPTDEFDSRTWPIILGVFVFLIVCGIPLIVCLVFKKSILRPFILRINTSLRATLNKPSMEDATTPSVPLGNLPEDGGAGGGGAHTHVAYPPGVTLPSAPTAPPPYDQLFQPFGPPKSPSAALRLRESSDSQAARVFNNPNYVRLPQNISSTVQEEEESTLLSHNEDHNGNHGLEHGNDQFLAHNEDTMESNWSPNENIAVSEQATEHNSAALSAPALTTRSEPPAKRARDEDSNNNREEESRGAGAGAGARGGAQTLQASQVVINVLTINNNEQHNADHRREHRNNFNNFNLP